MTTFLVENPLVLLIGACEVAFWVLVGAGLATRYLLRLPRMSAWLLIAVPVVDVVLVTASLVDVGRGTPPGLTHGLAAVYLGVTVAFGHSVIRWADTRFAYRFAGGPPPPRPPRHGGARVAYEWREWGKAALAWAITVAVLAATALVAGTGVPSPGEWIGDPLWQWAWRLGVVVVVWFVGWPLWVTLAPPRERDHADA
ncbi:hypothetical protein [Pseudonocardia sp.]|uniref:hypothetical protein n=1 Tax=Pseudonocardia sp. TaxID=60912 RepID=UPI003D137614